MLDYKSTDVSSSLISCLYGKSDILAQSSVISKNEETVNSSLSKRTKSLSLFLTVSSAILDNCSSVSSFIEDFKIKEEAPPSSAYLVTRLLQDNGKIFARKLPVAGKLDWLLIYEDTLLELSVKDAYDELEIIVV
ncbi:MAG: hypothetical protein WBZ20_15465 [Nitrososphaeraceae archaeon]